MNTQLKFSRALIASLVLALGSTQAMAGAYDDLIAAVYRDDTEAVASLVSRGLDVNTVDPAGSTLLHVAARNGNAKLMEILLNNKANPNVRNRVGDTALMLAAYSGKQDAVDMLLSHGAELNNSGWNPLHYAVFAQQGEMVSHLLAKGAKIDARAPNQQTALMLAAKNGDLKIANLLLKANADTELTDQYGETALSIAGKNNNGDIARLIEKTPKKAGSVNAAAADVKPAAVEAVKVAPVEIRASKPAATANNSDEYISPPFQTEPAKAE